MQRSGKNKPPLNKLVTEKNEILTDHEDIAKELNNFFTNIGPNMASKIRTLKDNSKTNVLRNITSSSNSFFFFFFEPCSESEIFREIMHLNDKKATGIENTPVKVIEMTAEYILSVLSSLFNKYIVNGTFPSKLKIAKITPIHKSGSSHKATNYRPISVLYPFSKIFEKVIYKRFQK